MHCTSSLLKCYCYYHIIILYLINFYSIHITTRCCYLFFFVKVAGSCILGSPIFHPVILQSAIFQSCIFRRPVAILNLCHPVRVFGVGPAI